MEPEPAVSVEDRGTEVDATNDTSNSGDEDSGDTNKRLLEPGGDDDMVCGLEVCDELDECNINVNDCDGDYTDEMTAATLKRENVAKARREEMEWYDMFGAYGEVTDETCVSRTGRKPISCRWKDTNKGGNERVDSRSRLIARDIKRKGTDSFFAGQPPLARLRCIISRAATKTSDNSWYSTPNEHSCTLTHRPTQLKQLSMCIRTCIPRFGHGGTR